MKSLIAKTVWVPLLLLAVAEATCRLVLADDFRGRFDYGYLPDAGFVQVEGGIDIRRTGGRRFYDQHFAMPKPADTLRIFAVGDSITRGESLDSAYPAPLAAALNAQGIKAEAYNLGVTAYGAQRKRVVLQQALSYQPDALVLQVNIGNEGYDARDFDRAEQARSWHPRNWFMKSYALRRVYEFKTDRVFNKYLPEQIRAVRAVRDPDAEFAAAQTDPRKAELWKQLCADQTRESVRLARAAGVPIVLIAESAVDFNTGVMNSYGMDELTASLAGPGVAVVKVSDVFRGGDLKALYSGDGYHWSPGGHQLIARQVAEKIEALRQP